MHLLTSLRLIVVASVAVILLGGCSNLPVAVYTVSAENVAQLRDGEKPLELAPFTGEQRWASCRGQRIEPDGNRTFAQYLHDALRDEILIADPPSTGPAVSLSATLVSIKVDCSTSEAGWKVEVDVSVGDEPPFRVSVHRSFGWNYIGAIILQRAQQAFVPAIQETIQTILTHPTVVEARST